MGRKGHDVFVLGDEPLITEPDGTGDGGSAWADEVQHPYTESVEGHEVGAPTTFRHATSLVPPRFLVLGLSVGAAAVAIVSMLLTGGGGKTPPSPARSSVTSSPSHEATVATKHVAVPSPPPRHPVHRSVKRPHPVHRHARNHGGGGMQRETNADQAHSTPIASVPSTPSPPSVAPAPETSPPVPDSLSPTQGGSGSGGGREFSFER